MSVPLSPAVVPPTLIRADTPAAAVLRLIRTWGSATRDEIVAASGLSPATVNRQVHALETLGAITERSDLTPVGGIGRPKHPFTVDREKFAVLGMHIGAAATLLVTADLSGRVLATRTLPTPRGNNAAVEFATAATRLAGQVGCRKLVRAGVASGGYVNRDSGELNSEPMGYRNLPLGQVLSAALQLTVSVSPHLEAMAAAELLLSTEEQPATSLLFYARETVGTALTVNGSVLQPTRGAGNIDRLPVCAPLLGADSPTAPLAQLDSVIGRQAWEAAAARLGVPVSSQRLQDERAAILGQAVALVRDILNPDQVIVAGQAFAEHPDGLGPVQRAFDEASRFGALELRASGFGARIQESAAIVVALGGVYADPVAVLG